MPDKKEIQAAGQKQKLSKGALANAGQEEGAGNPDFNSLLLDDHVDADAAESTKEFRFVC